MGFSPDTSGTLETSLEAFYKLDEVSGTRLDSIGSNDLTDNNTVGSTTGVKGNAADFVQANSEYLDVVDSADLSFANESMSISCWVRLTSKPSDMVIIGKWTARPANANREYVIRYVTGSDRFIFEVSSTGEAGGIATVVANNFGSPTAGVRYFITAWHDSVANTINIQVNNGAVNSLAHSLGIFDGTSPFALGAFFNQAGPSAGQLLNGDVDETGIWRKVLSAQERTDLYNGGSGNTFANSVLQTITTDTSIFGPTTKTIDSDTGILTGIFSETLDSDTEILPAPAVQTIDSDTFVQKEATQTIDSDTGVAGTTTQGIASNTSIVVEVAQSIGSDTNIVVNAAQLKLFKESDLGTEVGTEANPVDFSNIEAGLSVQHPDNPFVLFNDKNGGLNSVDAKEIVLSVLELSLIDELVGTSTGGLSQTFVVAFPPVETLADLTVKVNNVAWERVDTFIGTDPTDEIYTFDFTTGIVTFGDGTQGKIPPIGNTITVSYSPDTILFGKEVSEQLWIGVQSNDIIANTVTVDRERVTPPDTSSCQTLRSPITGVTAVWLNSDPNKLGTNFFSGGSFNALTGVITLGTSLPDTNDVLIDYTYEIDDDNEPTFVQIGRTTKSATLTSIPSNNGKKLNLRIVVPTSASPSSPNKIRFNLRVEYRQ